MRLLKVTKLKYALLVFISLVSALILTEVSLRIYLNQTTPIEPVACKREDSIVHHGYKPNMACRYKTAEWDTELKINSTGLRNEEIGTKDKFRVLVLGDSFTAAESVDLEKTAVYLAERNLNAEGKKVELVNAGVPSYSPILEYLWLREYGLDLDPDLVILNFDLGDVSGDNFMSDFYLSSEEILDEDSSLISKEEPSELWGDTRFQLQTTRAEDPGTFTLATKIKFWLHSHLKSYNFFAE